MAKEKEEESLIVGPDTALQGLKYQVARHEHKLARLEQSKDAEELARVSRVKLAIKELKAAIKEHYPNDKTI